MKIAEYQQMMDYLTGPRERFSNGGLATEDLAKKLGVEKNTIFTFKSKDSEVFKKIKKYFNVKQKSKTTPATYVLKKGVNLKNAIQDIKNFIGAPGGKGTRKATYGGKETTMSQVKNVLLKSKKPLNPDQIKELVPNMNMGTIRNNLQMLKNDESVANKIKRFKLGAKETAAKIRQTVAETNAPFMKAIRDQLVLDPDSNTEDLAKALFGDKKYNAVKGTAEQIRLDIIAERQLPKFLALFSKGAKTKTPGFKDIPSDKLGDIIESLETRLDEFGSLDAGDRRRLMLSIADTKRNLPERATETATGVLKQTGKEVDEVVGVSSTYNRAPGYIEATQVIDSEINQLKAKQIDNSFSKEFQKVLNGDYSGYKKYNQKAKAFAKKYSVDTPIIKIGENLQPEKFVSNFKDFSPEAQKNINQIAKDKGVVIQTKSKPLFSFPELGSDGNTARYLAALGCPGKAMGGRIGFQEGTIPSTQCVREGANIVNKGRFDKLSPGQKANLKQFLNRGYKLGRAVMKFGVIPEAIFAAGVSLVGMGQGQSFSEAFLRSIDYLLPGNQTKMADQKKFESTVGPENAMTIMRAKDYRDAQQKLNDAVSNLETNQAVLDESEFGYTANINSRDQLETDKQFIKAAEQNLKNKFQPEAVTDSASRLEMEAEDIAGTNNIFKKIAVAARNSKQDEIENLMAPEKQQQGTALPMLTNKDLADFFITDEFLQQEKDERFDGIAPELTKENVLNFYRSMKPEELKGQDNTLNQTYFQTVFDDARRNSANQERFFGTQGDFFGGTVKGRKTPTNRFSDFKLGMYAGGGIAKLAGKSSGPAPEKGPTPQGLDFLIKRGR